MKHEVRALRDGPFVAVPKIGFDFALWIGAASLAIASGGLWGRLLAVAFIGAVPMHDLLLMGHEGNHRMIARTRWINETLTWLTHALIGLSHTAHRAFHLQHHRKAHTPDDPEVEFLDSLVRGIPGWTYLLIPTRVHWAVNSWPLRHPTRWASGATVARDLAAALAMHAAAAWLLGLTNYAWFVLAPTATSFPLAFGIRSICEHHHTVAGSRWTSARHVETHPLLALLWSNVNYHLEHHLFPTVPFHRLPALRRLLVGRHVEKASIADRGYLRTAYALVREPVHFRADR